MSGGIDPLLPHEFGKADGGHDGAGRGTDASQDDSDPVDVDATPGGTHLRLFTSPEPKRHRVAIGAGALVLLIAIVAAVAVFSRSQGDLFPPTTDPSEALRPAWYDMVRRFVPDEFDHIALVGHSASRIAYLAIDSASGRSLDIVIERASDPASDASTGGTSTGGTTAAVATTISDPASSTSSTDVSPASATPDGSHVAGANGTSVEVACGIGARDVGAPASTSICSDGDAPFGASDAQVMASEIALGFPTDRLGEDIDASAAADARVSAVIDAIGTDLAGSSGAPSGSGSPTTAGPAVHTARRTVGTLQYVDVVAIASNGPTTSFLLLDDVYPRPDAVVRNPMTVYQRWAVGWLVAPDGSAIRATTNDASAADIDRLQRVLDSVGARAAS